MSSVTSSSIEQEISIVEKKIVSVNKEMHVLNEQLSEQVLSSFFTMIKV